MYGVNSSPTREEDKARASGESARVRAPLGIFSRVRQGKAEKSSKRAATDNNKKWSVFSQPYFVSSLFYKYVSDRVSPDGGSSNTLKYQGP